MKFSASGLADGDRNPVPVDVFSLCDRLSRLTRSDIHLHLAKLRELASCCEHVTEFGFRNCDGSTVALLAGLGDRVVREPGLKGKVKLVSWDLEPAYLVMNENAQALMILAQQAGVIWEPRIGDSREVWIEETDFLFIDTRHTYAQLRGELERHVAVKRDEDVVRGKHGPPRVRRWFGVHDTETYGYTGEDRTEPGLVWAIRDFQNHNWPLWRVLWDDRRCNGLTVLQREYDGDNFTPTIIAADGSVSRGDPQ